MGAIRVLVIEDNRDILENIGDFLEPKGYILDFSMDGIGGLHLAVTHDYDVIILDLMLPGLDGLTLCRKLRKEAGKTTPVIMLTARDTLNDKLTGFDAGTDDYLVKPFALQELEARIKVLSARKTVESSLLAVGDLQFNTGTREVTRGKQRLDLNNTCASILMILMKASPNVVTRSELEHELWGDMPPGSDSLRSHMYTLRRKIDKPFAKHLLETVHGVGFRIREQL